MSFVEDRPPPATGSLEQHHENRFTAVPPDSPHAYWQQWAKLHWIEKQAAALRRRLLVRGPRPGWLGRLAQAAAAFALAASLLLGAVPPRPAQAANTPAFAAPVTSDPFGLSGVGSFSAPTFADLDGDGDLDAVVGEQDGTLRYFENTGDALNPAFAAPVTSDPLGLTDVGDYSTPTLADLDADGDLDAVVGAQDGTLIYFENTGDALTPAFELSASSEPFGLTDVGTLSAPTFADLDGDGDLDGVVGDYDGNVNYFENTETAVAPAFAALVTTAPMGLTDVTRWKTPTFADLNGDGRLEAVVGGAYGKLYVFRGGLIYYLPLVMKQA